MQVEISRRYKTVDKQNDVVPNCQLNYLVGNPASATFEPLGLDLIQGADPRRLRSWSLLGYRSLEIATRHAKLRDSLSRDLGPYTAALSYLVSLQGTLCMGQLVR